MKTRRVSTTSATSGRAASAATHEQSSTTSGAKAARLQRGTGHSTQESMVVAKRRPAAPTSRGVRARDAEAQSSTATVLLVARPSAHGFRMIPSELDEALRAFVKKHGDDARKLPVSQMGSSLMDAQVVFKVKASLLPKLEALVKRHPEVAFAELSAVLRPSGLIAPYSAETLIALEGPASPAKSQALRMVHLTLSGKTAGEIPADHATRDALADATYSALQEYVHLFNASLLEATRERRDALLPETLKLSAYFGASEQAIAELREAGGTIDLADSRDLVLKCVDILERLGTPRSMALLIQTVDQVDGMVAAHLAARPGSVKAVTEAAFAVGHTRLDQTAVALARPAGPRPEGWRGTEHSRGYDNLPGTVQTLNGYAWSPNFPFTDMPRQHLTFLGTEHAPLVREALTRLLLRADQEMPTLVALHETQSVEREMQRTVNNAEELLATKSPTEREQLVAKWHTKKLAEHREKHQLNGQYDVEQILIALSWYGLPNEQVYSETRAFTQIAGTLHEVLTQVKSAGMHRLLADTALNVLERYAQRGKTSAEADAAAVKLREQLFAPGPDAEIPVLAAAALAKTGRKVDVARLGEGLTHATESVQSLASEAVEKVIKAGRAEELRSLTPALQKLLATTPNVWLELAAVEALGKLLPGDAAAVSAATVLASAEPSVEYVLGTHAVQKNYAMRTAAMKALAAHGARAAAAIPTLEAAVSDGARAKAELDKNEPGADAAFRASLAELVKVGDAAQAALTAIRG